MTFQTNTDDIKNLAAVLRKQGIAMTDMDSKRMAQDMLSGVHQERQVAQRVHGTHHSYGNSSGESHLQQRIRHLEQELDQRDKQIIHLNDQVALSHAEINQLKSHIANLTEQEKTVGDSSVHGGQPEQLLSHQQPCVDQPIVDTHSVDQSTHPQPSSGVHHPGSQLMEEDSESVQQQVHIRLDEVTHHTPRDEQLYEQEQEEIGFIGETPDSSINTQADAPPGVTEIPVESQKRGTGLTDQEKEMTDLTRLFRST